MLNLNKFSFITSISICLFCSNSFGDIIEEVIVLGDWRQVSQNKEDASIVLLNSEDINNQSINHFEGLTYLVPNLNFAASDSRARYFQIRGIGERSGYQGTPNSSVGFLIDDIDYSGQGGIATTFDVEQVEIHRGPQGSRMGANALAGLIYIKTKDPTEEFESYSTLSLGDFDRKGLGLAIGGPLENQESIQYRLAIHKHKEDGFRKNQYLKTSNTSRKDELTSRFKVNWKLNNDTLIKLLLSRVDLNDPADIWTLDGSLNTLSDRPGMDSQKTDSFGLNLISQQEGFDFQSLTSTTNTDVIFSYDADWGNSESWHPYVYNYFSETYRERKTLGQEFRFLSNEKSLLTRKKIQWVLGINYFNTKEFNSKNDDGTYGEPDDPYGPYFSQSSSQSYYQSENISFFGNIDFSFTETLKLSLGLRREDWKANYNDSFGERFSPSNMMNGGKLSLIKSTKNTNLFASIARGYKQGGFNLALGLGSDASNDNIFYDPEYLLNYEIGLKTISLDSRISFSAVMFYSDRKDQQVLISTQVDPSDPNTFSFITKNAAEGLNYGLELSIDYQINDAFNVYSRIGLLETEIKNWLSRPDLDGREQAHAPKSSYSVGLEWRPNKSSFVRLDVVGKSSFYYSDSHANKSRSYSLTNLSTGYQWDSLEFSFWVRNAFDKYYSVRGFYFGNEPPNFEDTLYERQGDPRHFGISLNYEF